MFSSLSDDFFLPQFFLEYIGAQLEIPITEYQYYGKGKNTMLNHLAEICDFYNYQEYTISSFNLLTEILEEAVKENFDELYLIQLAIQELRKNRILLPPLINIERLVRSIRNDNEKNLYLEINNTLSERQKEHLEQLLLIGEGNRSKLAWLKDISGKANKETAIITCLQIQTIREINLSKNKLSFVHENRLGQIARIAERYKTYDFLRFEKSKRYALLVAFLTKYHQVLVDHLLNVHTRILLTIKRSGQNAAKELQRTTGERANDLLKHYAEVIDLIKSSRNTGEDLFLKLDQLINWEN